ncbi:MAG: TIGR00725 family protein [Oricola sp.]
MLTIGVIGRSTRPGEKLPDAVSRAAYEVGRGIAAVGAALVGGGTGGVMEDSCRGAREGGGLTIGFLPYADTSRANPYVDLAFPTGMGTVRNILTARCCDSVIMIGGGVGTLNEVTIAYDSGVPLVVLEGTTGWADRLRGAIEDGKWLDERRVVEISFALSPDEAVAIALERAKEPRHGTRLEAHTGWAGQ